MARLSWNGDLGCQTRRNAARFAWVVAAIWFGMALPEVRSAEAHPHVWVTSATELIYARDGSLTGIRHSWTFDEMFSSYALQGLATKKKGVYTREELAPLAQTNVESLKEFGFFSFAKLDGRKQKFLPPIDYYLDFKNATLVLHFTLPLQTPASAKSLQLEIFDPSFFVDFALESEGPVKLSGAPAGCGIDIVRPTDGSSRAQAFDENSFLSGANSNYGAMFANKITVKCP